MKKLTASLLLAAMALAFSGCGASEPEPTPDPHEGMIYVNTGANYEWVELAEGVPVSTLTEDDFETGEDGIPVYTGEDYDTRLGIDVSFYQGDIDWQKVAEQGVEFAMIRCGYRGSSEGALFVDEKFQQNMQGAQRYWPKEMLNSFLAYYCSSRYNDSTLSEKQLDDIAAFHHELSLQQLKCGFDYDEKFWGSGNYRLNADKIKCPALIVQGLNDENVSTKQFEMMLKSFQKAGQTVKAILHQGPHITPTMPNKGYGILIDGKFYDDIVNEWISHYLYGVENQAEDMPAVLVQTNHDQRKWETSASWDTGHNMKLTSGSTGTAVIDTDWEAAGISAKNFDDVMGTTSTNMGQR